MRLSPQRHTLAVLRILLNLTQKEMAEIAGCSRPTIQAVELGNELLRTVRLLVERQFAGGPLPVTISVGAATVAAPRKNFPPHDLIEAAERCLYGGHVGGGNAVKSIEIY